MGNRVNKIMGYGLADLNVKSENYDLTEDDRIDPEGFFPKYYDDRQDAFSRFSIKEFYIRLSLESASSRSRAIDLYLLKQAIEHDNFTEDSYSDCITWEPECNASVIVFTPPLFNDDWYRHDSTMDYMEELARGEGSIGHVNWLGYPIYPHDAWIDLRDPESIPDQTMIRVINTFRFNSAIPSVTDEEHAKQVAGRFGFGSVQEMFDTVVPTVPPELVELLKFLRVFKDSNTIYQLRPMVYTYWA